MHQQDFIQLLDKYLEGTATTEEQALLFAYYQSLQKDDTWKASELGNSKDVEEKIWRQLQAAIRQQEPAPVILLYQRPWFKVVAAALVIVMLGAAWWTWNIQSPLSVAQENDLQKMPQAYAGQQVVLTLADGKMILLDSAANGVLARQGNTVVKKQGRRLIYEVVASPGTAAGALANNKITTPRGAQYQVIMSDGSAVWLNAASVLRFPASFAPSNRRVEVEGEAYFEVAKDVRRAFQVKVTTAASQAKGAIIEVLGTHFNINAYGDEPMVRTTLLEGSVKVHAAAGQGALPQILVPGQQAVMSTPDAIKVKSVEVEREVAWQKGVFDFEGANTHEVMRQLARWYDVEVVYRGTTDNQRFSGKISRSMALDKVLKILEQSGVRFDVRGRRITVLS